MDVKDLPKPTRNGFIVKINFSKDKTESGILIPEGSQEEHKKKQAEKLNKLEVVATGKDCKEVKVGSFVKLSRNSIVRSGEYIADGYVLFHEPEVIAVYK